MARTKKTAGKKAAPKASFKAPKGSKQPKKTKSDSETKKRTTVREGLKNEACPDPVKQVRSHKYPYRCVYIEHTTKEGTYGREYKKLMFASGRCPPKKDPKTGKMINMVPNPRRMAGAKTGRLCVKEGTFRHIGGDTSIPETKRYKDEGRKTKCESCADNKVCQQVERDVTGIPFPRDSKGKPIKNAETMKGRTIITDWQCVKRKGAQIRCREGQTLWVANVPKELGGAAGAHTKHQCSTNMPKGKLADYKLWKKAATQLPPLPAKLFTDHRPRTGPEDECTDAKDGTARIRVRKPNGSWECMKPCKGGVARVEKVIEGVKTVRCPTAAKKAAKKPAKKQYTYAEIQQQIANRVAREKAAGTYRGSGQKGYKSKAAANRAQRKKNWAEQTAGMTGKGELEAFIKQQIANRVAREKAAGIYRGPGLKAYKSKAEANAAKKAEKSKSATEPKQKRKRATKTAANKTAANKTASNNAPVAKRTRGAGKKK